MGVRVYSLLGPMKYKGFSGAVAPRAGAWIETSTHLNINTTGSVAPRAGAWIETYI